MTDKEFENIKYSLQELRRRTTTIHNAILGLTADLENFHDFPEPDPDWALKSQLGDYLNQPSKTSPNCSCPTQPDKP